MLDGRFDRLAPGFARPHCVSGEPVRTNTSEATWRSGDAADCKSVNAGSIPAVASKRASTCRPLASLETLKKIELAPRQRRLVLLCGALSGRSPGIPR